MVATRVGSLQHGVGESSGKGHDRSRWQAHSVHAPEYVARAVGLSSPGVIPQPVAGMRRKPPLPSPATGSPHFSILICGAPATLSPVLQAPVSYWLGAAVRRLTRRGVTPIEQ
jgi:hypothetical protein